MDTVSTDTDEDKELLLLSPIQRRFVRNYLTCKNGTEAARLAGYSPSGASVRACRLLRSARIQAAIRAQINKEGITKDNILQEVSTIARDNLKCRASDRIAAYALISKIMGWTKETVQQTQVNIIDSVLSQQSTDPQTIETEHVT